MAALFTGFITDRDGTVGGFPGTNTSGVLTVGMEPGSLILLPPGADKLLSRPVNWHMARGGVALRRTPHFLFAFLRSKPCLGMLTRVLFGREWVLPPLGFP